MGEVECGSGDLQALNLRSLPKRARIQNIVISKRQKRKSAVPTLYLYKLVLSKLIYIICYPNSIAQLTVLLQQKYRKIIASLEPVPGISADSSFLTRKRITISITDNPATPNRDPNKTPRLLPLSCNTLRNLEMLNEAKTKNKKVTQGLNRDSNPRPVTFG